MEIMSYNPITLILTIKKLTRLNYVDWKRNLDIVLKVKEPKWVTQEFTPIPNEYSSQEDKDPHYKWQKANEKVKYIILGSLDNVLQYQHMFIDTTYKILLSLQVMFGDKRW